MMGTATFLVVVGICVAFLVCAFRAENRAWEAEERRIRLKQRLVQLESELTPRIENEDLEFLAGWNMAMGKVKTMVREVRENV